MKSATLFDRLGGSPGIKGIVDDIVELHMGNPVIRARFQPYLETPEKIEVIKRHTCAFLEAGAGGADRYSGRSMPEAHRGMNINEAEYMAAVDDILSALRNRQIDERTQNDVLAIAYSLKGQILHV